MTFVLGQPVPPPFLVQVGSSITPLEMDNIKHQRFLSLVVNAKVTDHLQVPFSISFKVSLCVYL